MKSKLILIVDDDADTREVFSQFLVHHGYQVATAFTGEQAMQALRQELPDLVVMDLAIPSVDGWTLTTLLKGDQRTRHVPIVVVSAHVEKEDRARAERAGCDAFLGKPCRPQTLLATVQGLLEAGGAGG
ncbi:MAG: response regulator [Longimicrobiaceae bacterium]